MRTERSEEVPDGARRDPGVKPVKGSLVKEILVRPERSEEVPDEAQRDSAVKLKEILKCTLTPLIVGLLLIV